MSSDQLTNILTIILFIMLGILGILVIVYIALRIREKNRKNKQNINKQSNTNNLETETTLKTSVEHTKKSIYSFMKFDEIKDNMIISNNGKKFIMVVECQGVNYDLMSGVEKASTE